MSGWVEATALLHWAAHHHNTFLWYYVYLQVQIIQNEVLGVTTEECEAALANQHWSLEHAIKYLKIEQLFRLGIAARPHCKQMLERCNGDLERAGSLLIDEMANGSAV